jgi:hypothetical protein
MKFKTAPIFLAFLVLGCLAQSLAATEPALPAWAIGPFTRVQDGHPVISPNTNSVFDCPLSKAPVHWENRWANCSNKPASFRTSATRLMFPGQP